MDLVQYDTVEDLPITFYRAMPFQFSHFCISPFFVILITVVLSFQSFGHPYFIHIFSKSYVAMFTVIFGKSDVIMPLLVAFSFLAEIMGTSLFMGSSAESVSEKLNTFFVHIYYSCKIFPPSFHLLVFCGNINPSPVCRG